MSMRLEQFLPWLFVAAGIGCMALGALRGEVRILFEKAVNICLECVGIG